MADLTAVPSHSGPGSGAALRLQGWTDIRVFWILTILSAPGLFNYLLNQGPAAAWKQLLVVVVFVIAIGRIRTRENAIILWGGLAICFLLFLTSLLEAPAPIDVIYNSFFYISWLPFYVVGRTANVASLTPTILRWSSALIIISAIGLTLQYQTPIFDFLSFYEKLPELGAASGEGRRLGFIFGSSTLVLTTLAGFFHLLCTNGAGMKLRALCMVALVICAVPTGSLAAFVMLGGAGLIMMSRLSWRQKLLAVILLGVAAMAMIAAASGSLSSQLGRVLAADGDTSRNASSAERFFLWAYAVDLISSFTTFQHVFGTFIGSTNGGAGGTIFSSKYLAGESSFFQSYIEGGLLATFFLRALPFLLLFFAKRDRWENFCYGASLLVCCDTAPLMSAYGVQCVLAFIAGFSNRKADASILPSYEGGKLSP